MTPNQLELRNDNLHKQALEMDQLSRTNGNGQFAQMTQQLAQQQQQFQAGAAERPISYGNSVVVPQGNAFQRAQSVIVPSGYPSQQLSAVQPAQQLSAVRSSQPMIWAENMKASDAYAHIRSM